MLGGNPALLNAPLTKKTWHVYWIYLNIYLKYTLSLVIGWVLARLESQSHMSPMWVMGESHVTQYSIFLVPCVSQNYLCHTHALGICLTYLDMWVPCGHRFVNCGHIWLQYQGTPWAGSLRHYSSLFACSIQWHTAFSPMIWGICWSLMNQFDGGLINSSTVPI